MDQYIGRLLDNRYEILEVLGTGGMAVVYKARCHRLNRLVAIKILKDEFSADEEFQRRFHAEGEAVAMLSHPNIVQVYDVSSSDKAHFIVMELIDGISLKQYMEKKGTLNWKETLHFAMQIAKGLEHAHGRGIVHRDIKPHNVMVLKNGSVKVMDFGIARVMNKSNTLTKEALGSVHYISPEQAKGGYTDNRSDIYSLSVVMYEMMTGRPPYDGESAVAVAIQHINGGAVMPSTLNPNIPGGLEQIIMHGMSLEVKDRYTSATEMLQDMEEFRKNPAILFEYRSIVDDATRPITVVPPMKPRTTAEKMVQSKTGGPKTQISAQSGRLRQTGSVQKRATGKVAGSTGRVAGATGSAASRDAMEAARRAQMRRKAEEKKREEKQREEDERSRVATTAIVICSAVAIIAIVVFLIALFNGALLSQDADYVEVPYLLGEEYAENLKIKYKNLDIVLQPQEYDDSYEKGEIMRQDPAGGTKVEKGTQLRITISLGQEPEVKYMSDLVGSDAETAASILEGQGFVVIPKKEANYAYAAGLVIRTEPEHGTQLTEGQDVILWVSTGPDVVTAKMPDVIGKDEEYAVNLLEQLGFTKVRTRPVDSSKPAGTVIYQSEEKDTEIDVTTAILLEISKGSEEAEPTEEEKPVQTPETEKPEQDTEPTEAVEPVSRSVPFALPESDEPYKLAIQSNGQTVVGEVTIQPGSDEYVVTLQGLGTVVYDVLINGTVYNSQTVEFSNG